MASLDNKRGSQIYFNKSTCRILLKQGDLLKESVDVIVVPSPHISDRKEHFLIYKKVLEEADYNLKQQIDKGLERLERGKGRFISSHGRRYILSIPPYLTDEKTAEKLLSQTYASCLSLAQENGSKSIAFPTIGCGNIGFKVEKVAEIVFRALANFDKSKLKSIEEIRIVIFKPADFSPFVDVFMRSSEQRDTKIKFGGMLDDNIQSSSMGSKKSNPKKDAERRDGSTDYADDFETDEKSPKASKSSLNPNAQDFVPGSKNSGFCLTVNGTDLIISKGDLLKTTADAIVNVDDKENNEIYKAAGKDFVEFYKEFKKRQQNQNIPVGHSRILPGCDLKKTFSYIISTVPPKSNSNDTKSMLEGLSRCYETSLKLATLYNLKTIAFPPICCDDSDQSVDVVIETALKTVLKILKENADLLKITFVCPNQKLYDRWSSIAKNLDLTSSESTSGPSDKKDSTTSKSSKK